MDPPALPDLYARYQSTVWDSCQAWAQRALTDPVEVRRATARRFVRTCLSYSAWTSRHAASAGASHALVAGGQGDLHEVERARRLATT